MDKITLDRIETAHPAVRQQLRDIYKEICSRLTGRAFCRFAYVLRTFEEQEAIYAQGRTKPGKIVTNARGGQSYHNFGLACFSYDTEILTNEGWKLFSELNKTEKVMVFKDGKLFYESPLSYISNDYDGEMIAINTRSVDLLVTPNHKMIVQRKTNSRWDENWSEILAENIDYKYRIPTSGDFEFKNLIPEYPFSEKIDPETWWEFMGWYIAEGSSCGVSDGIKRTHNGRFKVSISQKEYTEDWHKIKDCLDRTGFTYNYIGHEFIIHSKELHSELFPLGNSYQKRIERYLLNAPRHLLEILYDSLLFGDGTHYENRETYWTVNKNLADDFSELCVLLGKSVTINERIPTETLLPHGEMLKTFNIQYAVNNRNRRTNELRNGSDNFRCITKEYYNGPTHCVQTKAGAVVVKRNGKVSVCGNCDIVLVADLDGNGTYETATWDIKKDFDGDGVADWEEIDFVFKMYGWDGLYKADGKRWDFPHFQKTFGYSIPYLLSLHKQGLLIEDKYVNI